MAAMMTATASGIATDRNRGVDKESKETLVGAATFAALIVVVALTVGKEAKTAIAADGNYRLNAIFNKIDGLGDGAQVFLAGLPIGAVDGMVLDKYYRAQVSMRISDGVKIPIDSSALIHTDGLFGGKYIAIEPGGDDKFLNPGEAFDSTQEALVVSDLLELIISQGKAKLAKRNNEKGAK